MSLKDKLTTLIKEKGKVHWKDLQHFCDENEYRWADNGSKRMREVRQKGHINYNPNIDVIYYPNSKNIEYYTWKPSENVAAFLRDYPSKPKVTTPVVPVGVLF